MQYCFLSQKQVRNLYQECLNAVEKSISTIEKYIQIKKNHNFVKIGKAMIYYFKQSLLQTESLKTIPYISKEKR